MKRFLTILLTTLALAGLLCVTASASSFDAPAAELSAIGMLKGGANGFDLDKVPTRTQAAIMLVRLFGAEDEAKAAYAAGDLKCPFSDVGETAAPHVAWLADKGLASGTSQGGLRGSGWALGAGLRIRPPTVRATESATHSSAGSTESKLATRTISQMSVTRSAASPNRPT